MTTRHRWAEVGSHRKRCAECRLLAILRPNPYTRQWWTEWTAEDGRSWDTLSGDKTPSCPPPVVEALCPWEPDARRYDHLWGDVQLDTAMRTWCGRHGCAVSECPNPGAPCPGWPAHDDGGPGRCTGREDTCRCMCPACCGDTPDVWGYDGDY